MLNTSQNSLIHNFFSKNILCIKNKTVKMYSDNTSC